MKHNYDVIVIGGGHAGAEAAQAAARMGSKTALITHSFDKIGEMSCNPAIGGLGKGHLVREIDALDGVMGRVADKAGIQFRLLNRRKGPAVQGPRAQADRELYRLAMQAEFVDRENLSVIEGEVIDISVVKNMVTGVVLGDDTNLSCGAVILTTGTFLRGVIHIGKTSISGGRIGGNSSIKLAERIEDLGLRFGRLKTGTPPRLDGSTINWNALQKQEGDKTPSMFSFLSKETTVRQVACSITNTNEQTHDIIRENLDKSAMYGGVIEGVGPRYCPSIEDKITRFSDKNSHQIFLEPEGLNTTTVYPNGISTSLPLDVQDQYVTSIFGLEKAVIVQPGYAIEYDYVDPRALRSTLELQCIDALFLAGQINGTTGYEEAAGQGLVAGLNAALLVQEREPIIFDRADGYIGVMIDDLVTRGVSEPYRMFTSRAEYRLSLRADNADQRLTSIGYSLGCVSDNRMKQLEKKLSSLTEAKADCLFKVATPAKVLEHGIVVNLDGKKRTALDLLSYPKVNMKKLREIWPDLKVFPVEITEQVENDARYAHYIERQKRDVEVMRRDEALKIPTTIKYDNIPGLSNELRDKLVSIMPTTLGQASRIESMTPAALLLILAKIRKVTVEAKHG